MFGNFQHSRLRIEVNASADAIRDSLLCPEQFQQWLWPQRFSQGLPPKLETGLIFTSWIGMISIQHQVQHADHQNLSLLLYEGIDGLHEWYWGEGWIQSCIEGVSVLPLNIGQTLSLMRLKQFLENKSRT